MEEVIKQDKRKFIITVIVAILFGIFCFTYTYRANSDIVISFNISFLVTLVTLLAYIDYVSKIIPNKILLLAITIRAFIYLYYIFDSSYNVLGLFVYDIIGALVCAGVFFVGRLLKSGVGAGDVKLFFVIGLYLGIYNAFSVLFYTVLASFVFTIVVLITKRMSLKDSIPLAPFAWIGLCIAILVGF